MAEHRNPMYHMATIDRAADEPTEYEVAVATLDAMALRQWVRRWYRSKYVPEDVLSALGLECAEWW